MERGKWRGEDIGRKKTLVVEEVRKGREEEGVATEIHVSLHLRLRTTTP